jgi:FkbH-like protein
MLGVCSKNDEAVAREVFEKHPHMPLKLDDFSTFCCNWNNKADNLVQMARELNIDLAHVALVDDNPAECELVRRELPQVAVVCLPEDPADFVRCLDDEHLFDQVRLSEEDRLRTGSYLAREKAETLRRKATDLDSYLASLEMVGECAAATTADLARLAQMEMKTNQFNLTTRRYGEEDLARMIAREDARVYACRLADKFANHGLVSSLILIREGSTLRVDSWITSCRVFSRTLESFILNHVMEYARSCGAARLVGEYLPTARNGVVKDLYASLGFRPMREGDAREWVLDLAGAARLKTFVSPNILSPE